jgi:hypothetical protein
MGCVELMNLEEEEEPYKGINNIEVCKNVEKYKEERMRLGRVASYSIGILLGIMKCYFETYYSKRFLREKLKISSKTLNKVLENKNYIKEYIREICGGEICPLEEVLKHVNEFKRMELEGILRRLGFIKIIGGTEYVVL